MKGWVMVFVVSVVFTACNDSADKGGENVGDTMRQDPTTGQPITTAPDTVGLQSSDSINLNRNK